MLQGSGQRISFSDIINEFGRASNPSGPGVSLGRYRVNETFGELSNLPLDTGIPQYNNQISLGNFHGKQLNTVVNYYHGGTETRVRTRNRYNNGPGNGRVKVIGGFRSKPNDPRIIMEKVSKKKYAAITYSGYNNQIKFNTNSLKLIEILDDNNIFIDLFIFMSFQISGLGLSFPSHFVFELLWFQGFPQNCIDIL